MRKVLTLIVPLLLTLGLTSNAEAAATDPEAPAWNTTAGAEYAASVMGVSTAQAAEDLTLQHDAFHTIGKLIEAGDQVWFDNDTAMVHVYGPSTSVAIPSSVASNIVHDATPHTVPVSNKPEQAASCGTSRKTEDFCSPMEAGEKLDHQSGAKGTECTAGFMVRDYSGNPYMITAAHCVIWGTTFYENPFYTYTWPKRKECQPGPWVHGISPWSGYDAAITPITGCGGVIPYYHDWEFGTDTHMEGATNTQYVGEYVCHFGVTSLYACGTIHNVDVTSYIGYESGEWGIRETDKVCGYAAPGDSGGPVTDGTYTGDATGILLSSGTNYEACPQGNGAIFAEQRIFAVLNLFDVYVAAS